MQAIEEMILNVAPLRLKPPKVALLFRLYAINGEQSLQCSHLNPPLLGRHDESLALKAQGGDGRPGEVKPSPLAIRTILKSVVHKPTCRDTASFLITK